MPTAASDQPVTAAIVGAGHRSLAYASYAEQHPDALRIVAVADPDPERRRIAATRFRIPPKLQFRTAQELAQRPQLADAVINGTMDTQHVPTALPLLEAGYHMLLEKPLATSEGQLWQLAETAARTDRKVMVCHVLRYAPFYEEVFRKVRSGVLGDLMNLQTAEHVSYHHMAVGYVHGKWNRQDTGGSSMLLAKCCHDLDLLVWLKAPVAPTQVASFGARQFFRAENAPPQAGTRCLLDCPVEADCTYSARKLYLDHPERWAFYVWGSHETAGDPAAKGLPPQERERILRDESPFGRCIWKCDNQVVDHQSVLVTFGDGATATHNMVGGAARPGRRIHLQGTRGELHGIFESDRFTLRFPDPRPGREYREEVITVHGAAEGHGGGDMGLIADFVAYLRDQPGHGLRTDLAQSMTGHLLGFRADLAMAQECVLRIPPVSRPFVTPRSQ